MVSGSISLPSQGFFSPFPHGTGSLSVANEYLALEGGPPIFTHRFTCGVLLSPSQLEFRLRGCHPLCRNFPFPSSILIGQLMVRLFRVRSPLLTESFSYFLLLRVLRCFSSPRFISSEYMIFNHVGCPIRTSTSHRPFAPHRSFSQLITSFVFSESLGIPHTLLFAFCSFFLSLYCYLLLACMSINFF